MNSVQLIGRLTKDIELRYTQEGVAVGSFQLAVNRPFKNTQGEQEADFISCQVWRKTAENLEKFTRKGVQIGIIGHIKTGSYENNKGKRVYTTDVIVEKFDLLERREKYSGAEDVQNTSEGNNTQTTQNTAQGNYGANSASRFGGYANQQANSDITVNDDDLPF
ncbi:single-stranded DNA-binding protein [Aerococcus viridans]|uniref:single-stranded DNA-binding protein n=1 Tax=Aerococcus viridans TaxID=1377 RepID=UPI0021AE8979|nr:single-stranded DNA-binding protein [Aerococcus viridans]MCT1798460.1 single-stranded DNA-binding protein [Aerococcus viridans]